MVAAVCTSATHMGSVVSDVISQAAATSFIHMHTLAANQVAHNMRKTGLLSGAKGEGGSVAVVALLPWAIEPSVLSSVGGADMNSFGPIRHLNRRCECSAWTQIS